MWAEYTGHSRKRLPHLAQAPARRATPTREGPGTRGTPSELGRRRHDLTAIVAAQRPALLVDEAVVGTAEKHEIGGVRLLPVRPVAP